MLLNGRCENGEIVNYPILKLSLAKLVKKKCKNTKTHILLSNKFMVLEEKWNLIQLVRSEIKDYLKLHIGQSIQMHYDNPVFKYK